MFTEYSQIQMTETLGNLNQGAVPSKYSLLYSNVFDDLERLPKQLDKWWQLPTFCSIFKLEAIYPSFVFNLTARSDALSKLFEALSLMNIMRFWKKPGQPFSLNKLSLKSFWDSINIDSSIEIHETSNWKDLQIPKLKTEHAKQNIAANSKVSQRNFHQNVFFAII